MIKTAPTIGRVLSMVIFAFSCFGILLFLWLQFGGATPLKSEKYLVKAGFPEAVGLLKDVDVRTAGITIGTVREVKIEEHSKRAVATLALDPEYAPLSRDARAILRRKTLLGETFVEITTGSKEGPKLPDGGRLANAAVAPTIELDEILQTYDARTRRAFQIWQQQTGIAAGNRGEDLSNAINRLPELTESGADLLEVLDEQQDAVQGLVRDTGEVYGALTRDEAQLAALIRNSHRLFSDTASQRENLAEAFHIFPTFLDESRQTLGRLERFSRNARPLVRDLKPVAQELRPTVAAARDLAPDLEHFFGALDQQIDAARTALPALREILDETRPLLGSLGPFLQEFNPIFEWLELHQQLVGDFLGYSAGALADTVPGVPEGEMGHYLRQLGVTGLESFGIHRERVSSNRGNAYLPPVIPSELTAKHLALPSWDCIPSDGEVEAEERPVGSVPGCWVLKEPTAFKGNRRDFPHVEAEDYGR
jgi:phospholipid/cholesterol/gamma-HCH transport system substrate-binding protein